MACATALMGLGTVLIALAGLGLLASIPNGDFDRAYQDDIPLSVYGLGLALVASATRSVLAHRERAAAIAGQPACRVRIVRTYSVSPPESTELVSGRGGFWTRFRAGLHGNPLLGLALVFNSLATVSRVTAAVVTARESGSVTELVFGFVVALVVVAIIALVAWKWTGRSASAVHRVPNLIWASRPVAVMDGPGSRFHGLWRHGPQRAPNPVNNSSVRRLRSIRVALTAEGALVVPTGLFRLATLELPWNRLTAVSVPYRHTRGLAFTLDDGREFSVPVRTDDRLVKALSDLGATNPH